MRLTRQHILEAANQIVQREGAAHLTIDAVAREAGLSKGGVLYHFPSKNALVEGMITLLCEGFESDLAQALTREKAGSGQWLRAYIRASTQTTQEENDATTGLLAAVATKPHLLDPIRRDFARWQEQAEHDGLSPALATVLRLAVDGLWFAELFGLAPPQGRLREEVLQALLDLTVKPGES
jgi:AcrR family transcriptional regulator